VISTKEQNQNMVLDIFNIIKSPRIRSSFIYLTGSIIGTGVAFILVPILTRYLTPYDYGVVSNFLALFTLSSYFICLSNSGYVFRNYFFLNKSDLSRSISNVFFINSLIAVIVLISLIILNKIILLNLQIPIEWLLFIPLISLSQILIDITLGLYQAQNLAKKYTILQLAQTVLNLALSIGLVVFLLWNWQGRILAQIITVVFLACISVVILKTKYSISFSAKSLNKPDIKDFLKFGVPLIPHSIGGFVLSLSDRFFLSSMVSVSAAGIYSVGATFGGLMMILHGAFYKVYLPYAFDKLSSTNDSVLIKKKLVKITYIYITIFIFLSFFLYSIAKIIFPWFVGPKFENAYIYVFWISLGYAMLAAYQMFAIYIVYTKKTKIAAFRTDFLAAIVKLPLTYFMIIWFGPIGAAQATFIAYFITAISAWYINNKVFPMPWFDLYHAQAKSN